MSKAKTISILTLILLAFSGFSPFYCESSTPTTSFVKFCEVPIEAKEVVIQNNTDDEIIICDSSTCTSGTYASEGWVLLSGNQIASESLSSDETTSLYVKATGDAPTADTKVVVTWKER